jgi:hypothetical protein
MLVPTARRRGPRADYFADPVAGAKSVPSRPGCSLPFTRRGSVRWHTCVCHVAALLCPLSSSPPRHRRMDKNPFSVTSTLAPAIIALAALYTARSLYRHVDPSRHLPPSLLAKARIAPTQCEAIKEDTFLSFCLRPHHCLPPVSRPYRASPLFLPLCRCRAASHAFRPLVQVPEHPPTSEKLPETWSVSPNTEAARHRHRASVRSATTSPSCSNALPPVFSCRTGVWDSYDVVGEHLLVIWPLGARYWSRHGGSLCTHCQMSSEPRVL